VRQPCQSLHLLMTHSTLLFIQLALAGWLVAGCWDWWCHRRTKIETTSGLAECGFHWALLAQGGLAVSLALLVKPSMALVACLALLWLAHQATTWVELRYVVQRRDVTPMEQMVHSFLEMIPLGLIVVIALDVWVQGTPGIALWEWQRRTAAELPACHLLTYAAASLVLVGLPFAEEAWRCYRHRTQRRPTGP